MSSVEKQKIEHPVHASLFRKNIIIVKFSIMHYFFKVAVFKLMESYNRWNFFWILAISCFAFFFLQRICNLYKWTCCHFQHPFMFSWYSFAYARQRNLLDFKMFLFRLQVLAYFWTNFCLGVTFWCLCSNTL